MPTDVLPNAGAEVGRLHRMESSIEELNARIARLAIGLGVSLKNESELDQVLHQLPLQEESPALHTPDRRQACQLTELRGLLVLRYGVEQRLVSQVGVSMTRQILAEAEEHLERVGFAPGADGINLRRLFDER
ncbi:MAG: hypothetical protein ABIQ90_00655 [Polaromonas sp.]